MLMINKERLYRHIQELGQIGKEETGGVTRFPYTKEDEQAKDYLIRIMKEAGLHVHIDAVGNIIGTRPGMQTNKILCGSHFDTVRNGGKFDGCLGILSAVEVLQTMNEQQYQNIYEIEVIAFRNEEGNRFSSIMTGSRAVCGMLSQQELLAKDEDGITVSDAGTQLGYAMDEYLTCAYDFSAIRCYLELHIEQGSVLDLQQRPVGIVKGIAGLRRYVFTIHGESGHSGAVPMKDRKDPVTAFSRLALFIDKRIRTYMDAVATIGEIHISPGSCNVIADHVRFSLDVRSLSMKDVLSFMQEVQNELLSLQQEGYVIEQQEIQVLQPALCDEHLMKVMQNAMKQVQLPIVSLMSGAGHDAMNFHGRCPMGMLFVRSEHGFSHRPEEYTSMEDCADAANVLYHTLVSLSSEKF